MIAPLLTFSGTALAAATTSITVIKYAADNVTVIGQVTIAYQTMQSTLPVQGDGVTHYFHQGPTFNGTMNVKCNSDWQVQVADQNTTTAGHMTKWMGTYVPGTKLTAPLTVSCTTGVDLSGSPQTIFSGTPAGQVGNSGQNCTVLFHQAVLYSDAVLTGGYSYHIVVTFTASVTI